MTVRALRNLTFKTSKGIVEIRPGQIFRPADPARLISAGLAEPVVDRPRWQKADGSCYAYHGRESWTSTYGVVVCCKCHPPAHGGLVARWTGNADNLLYEFEERAAIMEFDGGLSREDAEREALRIISNMSLRGTA